jgi:16S rRNA (uracil1498-N3)-methyltransferase
MRRRFFVDEVRSGRAELSGDDARHLTRVLRVEAGQRYEISDNQHVYLAEIATVRKEHVSFHVVEKLEIPAPGVRMVLCAALIKFDHFEWMIEKATELGVSEIVPVETIRSERGLERAAHKRIERWRRIALEASQQSRRAFLPDVSEPERLRAVLSRKATCRFALDENPATRPLNLVLPAARQRTDSVAVLIGPEGGWTGDERSQFMAEGWTPVSLGPLILRAETAALAALAIVNSAWLLD